MRTQAQDTNYKDIYIHMHIKRETERMRIVERERGEKRNKQNKKKRVGK